jgi:hypothetical protein
VVAEKTAESRFSFPLSPTVEAAAASWAYWPVPSLEDVFWIWARSDRHWTLRRETRVKWFRMDWIPLGPSSPVILIVDIMCDIFEVLHVCLDQKSSEKGEVWVLGIVYFYKSPRVLPTPNLLSLDLREYT